MKLEISSAEEPFGSMPAPLAISEFATHSYIISGTCNNLTRLFHLGQKEVKCTMLQLGFEGRGVRDRALFVWLYMNEGTICHLMCLVSRHVTKYNPIPQ